MQFKCLTSYLEGSGDPLHASVQPTVGRHVRMAPPVCGTPRAASPYGLLPTYKSL
jgi:hypothetical protein